MTSSPVWLKDTSKSRFQKQIKEMEGDNLERFIKMF